MATTKTTSKPKVGFLDRKKRLSSTPAPPRLPSHEYFKAHDCHLPPDKHTANIITCGPIRKFILRWTAVNTRDIRAQNIYRSYASLCQERYRQYKYYPLAIHPYSRLRLWSEIFFIVHIMISNAVLAMHFGEQNPETRDTHFLIMYISDLLSMVNIFLNFFTGYTEGNSHKHVILDWKKIVLHYIKTWLIPDLLSMVYVVMCYLLDWDSYIRWHLIFITMKIFRLPTLLVYLHKVLPVVCRGNVKKTLTETFILVTSYITWNIYFQFMVEYIEEGGFNPASPMNCSWITIAQLWNGTSSLRLAHALDRAVGVLRQSANINSMEKKQGCIESFLVLSWFAARLLNYHCALKYTIALIGNESAKAKYYIMTKQAETLMDNRKFPPRIKRKILKFYAIRYQSKYISEYNMMACVTGQLREDILMHTGRHIVKELEFLKQLPRSLLLQIGLKLKMVVFLAGDIIFKINTTGDCLYFIDKGTVAIYSESGNEICHLEDGDYFGEIALVTKQSIRTASAVAVTNCELFRLDKQDFDSTIAYYPIVYENIKKVAMSRFERTCLLDEHHKTELKMEEEHKSKAFDQNNVSEPYNRIVTGYEG